MAQKRDALELRANASTAIASSWGEHEMVAVNPQFGIDQVIAQAKALGFTQYRVAFPRGKRACIPFLPIPWRVILSIHVMIALRILTNILVRYSPRSLGKIIRHLPKQWRGDFATPRRSECMEQNSQRAVLSRFHSDLCHRCGDVVAAPPDRSSSARCSATF